MKQMPTRLCIFALVLIGLTVYFNSLFNDFFLSDDEDQIIKNPLITSVQNIPNFFTGSTYYRAENESRFGPFYRPLMLSSFTLTYSLFGLDPLFYHLFQIILHTTNSILLFFIFKNFFKNNLSFVFAAIFLVHPINSEVVLHAANTQEVLFMFFGLICTLTTLNSKKIKPIPFIFIYFSTLLLSYFGKETAIVFALTTQLYLFITKDKKFLLSLFLSTAATLIYLFFRIKIAGILVSHQALAAFGDLLFMQRMFHAPAIISSYFSLYFFPNTILNGYHWTLPNLTFFNFYLPLFIIISVLFIFIRHSFKTYTKSRNQAATLIYFFSILCFGLGIHLHIIALETTLTDRWFYLPQIGLLGIIGILLHTLPKSSLVIKKSVLISLIILSALSSRTFIRTFDWRDSETLILSDLSHDPNNYYFQNLLGSIYLEDGRIALAKPRVLASVALRPNFGNLNNAAIISMKSGDFKMADAYFQMAIDKGLFYTSRVNYSNFLYYIKKDYTKALELSGSSLSIYPKSAPLWVINAQANFALGNKDQALGAALTALKLDPSEITFNVYADIKSDKTPNIDNLISK